MKTPGVAPPWALTTCQVLASNPDYSHYLPGRGLKNPSANRLWEALCRMSYKHLEAEQRGEGRLKYEANIKNLALNWCKVDHESLMAWLAKGGHTAELDAWKSHVKSHVVLKEEATRAELISREMEADEDSHVALMPELRRPEQTLEEVLEDFDRNSTPGSGEW